MNLAQFIDHTLLKPGCQLTEVQDLCQEALTWGFKAVCVPPYFVKESSRLLHQSDISIATVVGFPMGYSATPSKVEEVKRAIDDGAHEIDAVVNLSALKSGDWNYVRNDISSMTTATHLKGRKLKLIFETGLLHEEEIRHLADICNQVEVDFLKTSTGFAGGGATPDVVRLLAELAGPNVQVKASGGIRSLAEARAMIEAGATRLGCSAGVQIMQEMSAMGSQ